MGHTIRGTAENCRQFHRRMGFALGVWLIYTPMNMLMLSICAKLPASLRQPHSKLNLSVSPRLRRYRRPTLLQILSSTHVYDANRLSSPHFACFPSKLVFFVCYSPHFTSALLINISTNSALVPAHPTFPHHTSSLPKISPCSPRSKWMAFGLYEE